VLGYRLVPRASEAPPVRRRTFVEGPRIFAADREDEGRRGSSALHRPVRASENPATSESPGAYASRGRYDRAVGGRFATDLDEQGCARPLSRVLPPARRGQLWLIADEGKTGRHFVADVALDLRRQPLYSYAIPDELLERVRPGVRVRVPYGSSGRLCDGWCVGLGQRAWDHTLKSIRAVRETALALPAALVELGLWVADYYAAAPGLVLDALLPALLRDPPLRRVVYVRRTGQEPARRLTAKQAALLEALGTDWLPRAEALRRAGVRSATLATLRKAGVVALEEREEPAVPAAAVVESAATACAEDDLSLTAAQQAALQAIERAAREAVFGVTLLLGVPGSGKTEVYVRAIRSVIAGGRQAILLVPEIALATQIAERLARRFERVAVLHSRQPARRRAATLRAVAEGAVDLVIGTRSAVFAPLGRLGLIVVDEEQESSLKNLAAPYYHARDVAIKRAQLEGIPVVLGSATPALETWHNARTLPHYRLLRLPERVPGAEVPRTRVVSAAQRELGQTTQVLSAPLAEEIQRTLAAGHQVILLHNRRGYAVFLSCSKCGLAVTCQRCAGYVVLHRGEGGGEPGGSAAPQVKCHRCGWRGAAPAQCIDSSCGGRLRRSGMAIQRLEEELRGTYPGARLLRLDSDTMRRREDYAEALRRFEQGEAEIMLGTQMIAKGLDFPNVRLVGVIDADATLWLPDFRAAEQVFQLLVQVVGRAGRRIGRSLAVVQVSDAELPAIGAAHRLDYEAFVAGELELRQRAGWPPFVRLVRFLCLDARPGRARDESRRLEAGLRNVAGRVHPRIEVFAAERCAIPRLRDMLRYAVLVRAPREVGVQRLLHEARAEKVLSPRVQRFTIDVDPLDML